MKHTTSHNSDSLPALGKLLSWPSQPQNRKLLTTLLLIICIALFMADFTYKKYGHFEVEAYQGFHGFFGFLIIAAWMLIARWIAPVLARPEDYYGPKSTECEDQPLKQLDKEEHSYD